MPSANAFRHQVYSDATPESPFHLLEGTPFSETESDEFLQRMIVVGDQFRKAGITDIYLVHGTFVGGDAAGLWGELAWLLPGMGDLMRQISRKWIHAVVEDRGNYTEQYRKLFEDSIHRAGEERISVRLFHWTSENHHIGRADAAVRLIDEVDQEINGGRVMLWGHSHAGNVFALMSNLLRGDADSIDRFFNASRACYRNPITRRIVFPVWDRVRKRLQSGERPCADTKYDFVTFGTPVRYGWEMHENFGPLHFVNHRPTDGRPEYLTRFPASRDDVLRAVDGDYVQQFGIAGTNIVPGIISLRKWWADRKLNQLLQPEYSARDLLKHLKYGMRVPADGITLLVDYGLPEGNVARHLAGHAVYTQLEWLLFHAEQTVRFL